MSSKAGFRRGSKRESGVAMYAIRVEWLMLIQVR